MDSPSCSARRTSISSSGLIRNEDSMTALASSLSPPSLLVPCFSEDNLDFFFLSLVFFFFKTGFYFVALGDLTGLELRKILLLSASK